MNRPSSSASSASLACLEAAALRRALALRDLSDPAAGPHAMQLLIAQLRAALARAWPAATQRLVREPPIVSPADNYDLLGYPPEGPARAGRYTRYLSPQALLRTQTTAMIPRQLQALAREPGWRDVLLLCPGLVYRRDAIDRRHVGEPHQLDLWRLCREPLPPAALRQLVARVCDALLPGAEWRVSAAEHDYTCDGLQVDIATPGGWVELLECGRAAPSLLTRCGLDPRGVSGLALGLGLDRALMLRKGIDDIRLLRSEDPRVQAQLLDLSPYRAVSAHPPSRRDLSLAVDAARDAEDLGARVREALGEDAERIESLELLSECPPAALPPAARARLGLRAGQKNALVRAILRHPTRALSPDEANALRDRIYAALHEGSAPSRAPRRESTSG